MAIEWIIIGGVKNSASWRWCYFNHFIPISMSSSHDSDSTSDFEDIETSDEEDEETPNTPVANEQWVEFIQFCSVESKSNQSITKGTGVEKLCQATDQNLGEKESGWILNNNNREETLVVSFTTPVFINEVHLYESLNPGSVVKLEMLEPRQNKWWMMWQRKTSTEKQSKTHPIFKPLLRRYPNRSNTIRITLDPRYTDRIGIQAIKLLGSNIFDTTFHRKPLVQSMMKLYDQALNNINTDVQFCFHEKIISAHRNILCCRSQYFRSLLVSDFMEKRQSKPIELTDINYQAFLEILYFIYTGAFHPTITYDIALESMIYSNKINLLSARNAAMEHICRHLRLHHNYVVTVYCLAKKMSPAFDVLLDYIYDLCSENLKEISQEQDFIELDKEYIIDIICQSAERRETREQEKAKQLVLAHENATHIDEEE